MTWFTGLMVYLVLWWLVFFAVLPFGVRVPDEVEQGHATSAPARPRLWLKAGITTLIAAVLWAGAYWLITSDFLSFYGSGAPPRRHGPRKTREGHAILPRGLPERNRDRPLVVNACPGPCQSGARPPQTLAAMQRAAPLFRAVSAGFLVVGIVGHKNRCVITILT